jgi:branched-chain amino acid transport system permease protein
MDRFMGLLNGPQTLGRGPGFWIGFLVVVGFAVLLPEMVSRYQVIKSSNLLISGFLALSLCLLWGYCGILSLGQAAFYGIGGYAYGIVGLNLLNAHGDTNLAVLAGVLIPVLFAFVIGSAMFYARLKGVYVAILLLVISLLLETFMLQTADPSYTIGAASLGGFNGLRPASPDDPLLPSLTFALGDLKIMLDGRSIEFYYFVLGLLVAVYLLLRCLVNSSYGYILLGCREEPGRTETFGYDVRKVQLGVFCISAALAGLAGVLYTGWGTYVHPKVFSVAPNILVVIWVAVGGRKDLTAALIGAIGIEWLSLTLGAQTESALLVLGLVLVVVMLLAPEGIVLWIAEKAPGLFRRLMPQRRESKAKNAGELAS